MVNHMRHYTGYHVQIDKGTANYVFIEPGYKLCLDCIVPGDCYPCSRHCMLHAFERWAKQNDRSQQCKTMMVG